MNPASFKDLKKGVKTLMKDAIIRARRLRRRLGAPQSYVKDVLETEFVNFLDNVAKGEMAENFVTDLILPDILEKKDFRRELQTPQLRTKLPKTKKPIAEDEWRLGHLNGWICRDHYLKRRVLFTPIAVTCPRFFPVMAFTGERRTVMFDAEGNVTREIRDNWMADRAEHPTEEWCGETWLKVHPAWIERQYPRQHVLQFRHEIQEILYRGDTQGVYTLQNGDKLFVGRQTSKVSGMLPSDQNIAISSFMHTVEDGWMMLEDKVRHRDRAHLRLKHACLVKAVPIYVQIHYESLNYDTAPGQAPLVGELYTETEPVSNAALRRGHQIATSITLNTGYNLLLPKHRQRATKEINENRPFCLVIAFPCSIWSSLANLTAGRDPQRRAIDQVLHGAHFIMENPATSSAWRLVGKLKKLLEKAREMDLHYVRFDQCRFGLLGAGGGPHQRVDLFKMCGRSPTRPSLST